MVNNGISNGLLNGNMEDYPIFYCDNLQGGALKQLSLLAFFHPITRPGKLT